jgi:hypothetical protein
LARLAISVSVSTLISGWTRLGRSMLETELLRMSRQTTALHSITFRSGRWCSHPAAAPFARALVRAGVRSAPRNFSGPQL